MTKALPLTVDEVNVEWLNHALAEWTQRNPIIAIEDKTTIWGTGTKILMKVTYANGVSPGGPPADLCVKGGFMEELRHLAAINYLTEAYFYAHAAKQLTIALPGCWYAQADPERGQGIMIFDNLVTAGATFGDLKTTWHPDNVALVLEVLASLHAQTWGATTEKYPGLLVGAPLRESAIFLVGKENWQHHFSLDSSPQLPPQIQDQARVYRALFEMWRLDDLATERCLCHSDAHIGNTFQDANGKLGYLDWQVVAIAPHMDDVSNVIGGSLTISDRRAHERKLFQHYLDALSGYGGPRLTFDTAWLDYRRYQMHGILWATCPESMQPSERRLPVTERHMAAIIDHDTINLLLNG